VAKLAPRLLSLKICIAAVLTGFAFAVCAPRDRLRSSVHPAQHLQGGHRSIMGATRPRSRSAALRARSCSSATFAPVIIPAGRTAARWKETACWWASDPGRWRTDPRDEEIRFESVSGGKQLKIIQRFTDGSSSAEIYARPQL